MNLEHTPGPLSYYYDGHTAGNLDYCVKNDTTGTVVAWTCTEANALLISKAPEMLKALIDMLTEAEYDHKNKPNSHRETFDGYYEREIKVLADATGKTWDELKELI
jgi:hypothetical protein